jgi:spore germination cell wall hydrolase CwlJ-like protein
MKLSWSALPLALVCWLGLPCASAAAETPQEAVRCLALTMYWEAKTEGADGMLAVASVVLNRRDHPEFPDTVCGVVKQGGEKPPCQFSWWCDGKSDRPTEAAAWQLAQSLAQRCLSQTPRDATRGALFFHDRRLKKTWLRERQRTVQIGHHVFYR